MPRAAAQENGRASTVEDTCPWCGQPIPHEKFAEITGRIRATEKVRTRELEGRLRAEQEAVLASVHAAAQREIDKAKKLFEAQAAEARRKADAAAKAAQNKLLAEQRARDKDVLESRLREQRDALTTANVEAINAEKARAFAERQKLETRLAQLQRQVAQQSAGELGEGAEVNLYDLLREEFPDDSIVSVKKGQLGADIVHRVVENGRACGQIVYDSKSKGAWRNSYVARLADDKIAAKADHAVLLTRVFPAGQTQLCIRDGVIVVNPARAVALAQLIRKHIVQLATLRLADAARAENTEQLYDFITSDRCRVLLDQIGSISDKLLDLDVKEHRAHTATWKQRGQLIREVQQARGTLITEIDLIVTAPSALSGGTP
jgi:hypothetical protein